MKLYFSPGACSLSVRILLHELGIAAEYERVDFKTAKTESGQSFADINPKGVVPVLITNENERLTENIAIHQFLTDKYKNHQLLPAITDFSRYRVLEFSSFIATDLHKNFGPLFNPNISDADKNNLYIPLIKKRFTYLNSHLQNKSYLVNENFTIADAYLFVITSWLSHFKIALSEWQAVEKYFLNLKNRESIQKSLAEEKAIMKNQNSHSGGTGSDKQHPETPPDANDTFRKNNEKENKKNVQEHPGEQNTG